jgi:hypothetical protein
MNKDELIKQICHEIGKLDWGEVGKKIILEALLYLVSNIPEISEE